MSMSDVVGKIVEEKIKTLSLSTGHKTKTMSHHAETLLFSLT